MPEHGMKEHLLPFLPYVEKGSIHPLESPYQPITTLSKPIHLDTLRSWLHICDAHHSCYAADVSPRVSWLIDVTRGCIISKNELPSCVKYVALSYVWGASRSTPWFTCLTKDTRDHLCQRGSLDRVVLPRTITDAIKLCKNLEICHLWVDRLCIVQDDESEKQQQLKVMAKIYEEAYFTLVAAQSHDAYGPLSSRRLISDLSPLSRFSSWVQTSFKVPALPWSNPHIHSVGDQAESGPNPTPGREPSSHHDVMTLQSVDLLRTVWFSRGWTFQEYLFSKRTVYFHNNTVNWECLTVSLHENQPCRDRIRINSFDGSYNAMGCICPKPTPSSSWMSCLNEVPIPPLTSMRSHMPLENWPNFRRYCRLVAIFTPRFFTYPEDVHDAFSGASQHWASVFPGGLVTGLPASVFDSALLWQPYSPMEPRVPSHKCKAGDAVFPSWSWMSYRGNVQSESWEPGFDVTLDHGLSPGWYVTKTIDRWEFSDTLEGERQAIPSTSDFDTASGWHSTHRWYEHDSIPGEKFYRPIPLALQSPEKTPALATRSRFLHTTSYVISWVPHTTTYHAFAGNCAILLLPYPDDKSSDSVQFAGILRLNTSVADIRDGIPAEVDLIELSSGYVSLYVGMRSQESGSQEPETDLMKHRLADVFDEWSLPQWKQPGGYDKVYEFYNVMWVKWLDEGKTVAERMAIGRVEKTAWEHMKMGKKRREVTLA
ncbi:heterokaryon incompatibility protein-domain-containing protein [Podospora australis]|uniref:Heterokaryon incompatibility protein-domain-containing protein n=1 Tax=Podospora australis TaxID=1536484 RepID=A0AAN6WL99_9PEZI|nr:heterokaryon incompatibility protein-domain-containing protein [Podospora australis]